jgi:hypothetical protein
MTLAPRIEGTAAIRAPANRFAEAFRLIAWAMVLFWGFAWPWLLIGLHKCPLRRLVTRIVAEADEEAAGR